MKNRYVLAVLLFLASGVSYAQPVIDVTAPPLPPAYTVQPAPPQFWIPCGAVAAPLPPTCTAADGTIVDLRNETFYVLYSANPALDTGPCSYTGAQARPTQRYPLGNPSDVNPALGIPNVVLRGGRIVGNISLTLDGFVNASVGGYCNSAALDLKNVNPANTHPIIDSMRIDRVWDAIRFNKEPCYTPDTAGTPTGCNRVIRDTWVSNARDDAVEDDLGYAGMSILNSLFDGVFSLVSMAPGGTIHNHASEFILIDNTLIRMQGWPYGELQPDGITRIVKPYHIAPFKTGVDATRLKMPKIEMHDSVINASVYIPNNTSNIATGTHWAYFFRQVGKETAMVNGVLSDVFVPTRCSNNVFLWTSDDPLPATMVAEMPASCFTVLTGADARWYWEFRKAGWIADHTALAGVPPGLENLPGMPKPVERIAGDP